MLIFKLKYFLSFFYLFPLLFYYKRSKNKNLINSDIELWVTKKNIKIQGQVKSLVYLLRFEVVFRNLFYFRIPQIPNILKNILCHPSPYLTINTNYKGAINDIEGGGLFFIHPFGTIITAKSIGKNCIFRQLTTIGSKSTDKVLDLPTIGNNVDFGCNVNCIGKIKIGNNVIVGAGAVIVKDIPDFAIVAGNPAKIIGWNK